jgi:hypothetical protein
MSMGKDGRERPLCTAGVKGSVAGRRGDEGAVTGGRGTSRWGYNRAGGSAWASWVKPIQIFLVLLIGPGRLKYGACHTGSSATEQGGGVRPYLPDTRLCQYPS